MRINEVAKYNTHNLADVQHCPYYFAYGMNTNTHSMEIRTQDHVMVGTGTLPDYELVFKHHCDIVRAPGIDVLGVLWKTTQRGLTKLDQREGYPEYYDRQVMWINNHDGESIRAWVYYMNVTDPEANELEPPNEQYWNIVVAGYRQHGLSTHQLELAFDKSWAEYEKKNSSDTGDTANGHS